MEVTIDAETHEGRCDKCSQNKECIRISATKGDRHISCGVNIVLCETCVSRVFKKFKKGE